MGGTSPPGPRLDGTLYIPAEPIKFGEKARVFVTSEALP
jgi:hypothetical protein